ncbi:DUF5666 domain-containing protein [Cognatilysobacter bugurensis]|uniref:DUF5666 domain-containing protein n=1 Tax=Cognatilysobacter bugurensis TaxID=543356 RepID=A0A918W691_9GAMM|nr:DUF5666 domain-containing protein [Lysobacter bugurensis]GHA70412.1 hypothetical protein GCM10007067_03200 [Lysobacter bugurensis]
MNPNSVRWIQRARATALGGSVLLLAACATPYGGGYPGGGYRETAYPGAGGPVTGYPGGQYPGGQYPGEYGAEVVLGTVQQVDPNYGRIVIASDGSGYGGARALEIAYDRGTRLVYQGRDYPVEGLERGDRIRVETTNAGGRLQARFIEVVQNVREAPSSGYGDTYGGAIEGAVRMVDPRARLIEITRGGYTGRAERVFYDERTEVVHRGQRLRPEQLQSGDVIRVQARRFGQDWLAERVEVQVDARSRYP